MVSKIWKGIAIVTACANIILFFIMGILAGNFWLIPLGIVVGFFSALGSYTIGEVVEQLEISNHNTYEIHRLLKRIAPEEEKVEKRSYFSAPSAPVAKRTSDGGWICKKCQHKNDANVISCANCGEYK